MRTRSKYSPGTQILVCTNPIRGYSGSVYSAYDSYWFGGNTGPLYSYKECIEDLVAPAHSPRSYNNCRHVKSIAPILKGTMQSYCGLYGYMYPGWIDYNFEWPMMWDPSISVAAPWNSMVDELAALADGTTNASCQLPVTLLEGAKTIAMVRNPFNLLKPNFRRQVRKLTARTLASKGANVWLEGYYGWKSMYQDLEGIAKATAAFLYDDHQKYLLKLGERLAVRHSTPFHAEVIYGLGTDDDYWNRGNPHTQAIRLRVTNVTGFDNCVLGCRQFQDVSSRIDRTKRFLNLSGLTPNWRTIRDTLWEVTPFSFVVDWFVDTRGLWAPLNKWRLGQMDIKDIGYSTHVVRSYSVEAKPPCNPFYFNWGCDWLYYLPTSTYQTVFTGSGGLHSIYTRYGGFPSEPSSVVSFNTKGLSFIRSVNGAALIAQLLTGKKR